MRTEEYIKEISKEFGKELEVRKHPHLADLVVIYYNGVEICPAPANEIYDNFDKSYCGNFGQDRMIPHPSKSMTRAKIAGFLTRWEHEEGFKELMTENL